MHTNVSRIQKHIEEIEKFTATPGNGTTRLSYSPEDQLTRNYIKKQMNQYGLTVREDTVGNIYGRLEGKNPDLPAVIIGSHFDSVPNGGSFDGPAGVVTGLEVAAVFQEEGLTPTYPVEIIAMIEEEGSRFGSGLLGSRMIAGHVSKEQLDKMRDSEGVSATDAMKAAGFNAENVQESLRTEKDIKAFLELHIEQGPVLENAGEDIALVDTIVATTQTKITVKGKAGHAGTTPMDARTDALVAAAELITQLPKLALEAGEGTVLTVGKLNVHPNGANVIPNEVVFIVDARSKSEELVQTVLRQLNELASASEKNGITIEVENMLFHPPVNLSKTVHQQLAETSEELGLKYRTMISGAGHDAMVFAGFTEVGLIFVPSKNGLSHTPEEWTDYDQLQKGIEVIYETVKKIAEV